MSALALREVCPPAGHPSSSSLSDNGVGSPQGVSSSRPRRPQHLRLSLASSCGRGRPRAPVGQQSVPAHRSSGPRVWWPWGLGVSWCSWFPPTERAAGYQIPVSPEEFHCVDGPTRSPAQSGFPPRLHDFLSQAFSKFILKLNGRDCGAFQGYVLDANAF